MKKLTSLIVSLLLLACTQLFALSVAWNASDPSQMVTAYKVYRVKGNSSTLVGSTSSLSLNVDNFLSGNRTVFYVTAVNAVGESLPSSKVTVQRH